VRSVLAEIGDIPIGTPGQFPYGWRKAAKGRTVWRLLEEAISQNLESRADSLEIYDFVPAVSEVGVFDFHFRFDGTDIIYVNVKSAVAGGPQRKDDISKGDKLLDFYSLTSACTLFLVTIDIKFLSSPLRLSLSNCYVIPVSWLPDIHVNPRNRNLQSSKYKDFSAAVPRSQEEFIALLRAEWSRAMANV
jgi:hypothetical protein